MSRFELLTEELTFSFNMANTLCRYIFSTFDHRVELYNDLNEGEPAARHDAARRRRRLPPRAVRCARLTLISLSFAQPR